MAWRWLSAIVGWLKKRRKHKVEYGVAMHHYIHDVDSRESDEMDARALDKMKDRGCKWFRSDYYWNFPLNVPHLDNKVFVSEVHNRGGKVIFIIDGWSCPTSVLNTESQVRQHIAKIVADCPNADAWEIWNEINIIDFQLPNCMLDGDPANYVDFLRICNEEIRKISVAPILTAGLSPGATGRTKAGCYGDVGMISFLEQIVSLGAMDYVDKVGFHYYNADYSYPASEFKRISGKALWCTEVGYPSVYFDGSVRETEQATAVKDWMAGIGTYAEVVCWYCMMDYLTRSNSENSFGLLRTNYDAKPSYDAYGGAPPNPIWDTIIMAAALTFTIGFVYYGGPRQVESLMHDLMIL